MARYEHLRIYLFLGLIVAMASLIGYRLFYLSVVGHANYARTAQAQNERISNILARGNIYLTDKENTTYLAATNKKFAAVYVVSSSIKPESLGDISAKLSTILGIDRQAIQDKITKGGSGTKVVARKITPEQVTAVNNLNTKGVGISYEMDRFYPAAMLASNVIGFLGYNPDGQRAGQYGIEGFYDEQLFGQTGTGQGFLGSAVKVPSALKNLIGGASNDKSDQKATADVPADLFLTIDKNIQTFVEVKLDELLKKWSPERATVIVEDPSTGKILAMADRPTFDLNNYQNSEPSLFLNRSMQEMFEPGSSFKPITMAAGLDLGKVTPDTTYNDTGVLEIDGYPIHNFDNQAHGTKTMTQVLEKSLNTGAMFVQTLVGNQDFLNYVINFGFGQGTGIDLPGEVSGDITNLYSGRRINFLTASFGQGIAVTPLQMISAYSAIANGGHLMKPYTVEKIVKQGQGEMVTKPEVVGIPITDKTAARLKMMLTSVVDNGFDKARISGYDIAGKTGTAQTPDGHGGYLEGKFIHSFVGFAPSYNAKFVVLIKMDKPQGITFAADSLSPTFREIANYLLRYYNIPPTRQ